MGINARPVAQILFYVCGAATTLAIILLLIALVDGKTNTLQYLGTALCLGFITALSAAVLALAKEVELQNEQLKDLRDTILAVGRAHASEAPTEVGAKTSSTPPAEKPEINPKNPLPEADKKQAI